MVYPSKKKKLTFGSFTTNLSKPLDQRRTVVSDRSQHATHLISVLSVSDKYYCSRSCFISKDEKKPGKNRNTSWTDAVLWQGVLPHELSKNHRQTDRQTDYYIFLCTGKVEHENHFMWNLVIYDKIQTILRPVSRVILPDGIRSVLYDLRPMDGVNMVVIEDNTILYITF